MEERFTCGFEADNFIEPPWVLGQFISEYQLWESYCRSENDCLHALLVGFSLAHLVGSG